MELRLVLGIKNLAVAGSLGFLFNDYFGVALLCGATAYLLYRYYRKVARF
jgi:hypothetical protein